MSRVALGVSSTASPGLTWASFVGWAGRSGCAKPVLPVSSTKILTGAFEPVLRRDGLLAGLDEQDAEAVDVALGDAVGRVEGERGLVVLARGAELAELPEGLGEAVLGLGVRAQLEEPAVRLGGLGPLGGGGAGDRLLGELALEARLMPGLTAGSRWRVSISGKVTERSVLSVGGPRDGRRGARRARTKATGRSRARIVAPRAERVKRPAQARRVRRAGPGSRPPPRPPTTPRSAVSHRNRGLAPTAGAALWSRSHR